MCMYMWVGQCSRGGDDSPRARARSRLDSVVAGRACLLDAATTAAIAAVAIDPSRAGSTKRVGKTRDRSNGPKFFTFL